MDFVLLCSVLPAHIRKKTRPVAASDYWNRGGLRQYIIHRAFRAVVIDRRCSEKAANPLGPMIEALDRGESLVLFPEGTRGTGEEVQPFKCGIFHLARARPHIELIPVWIDNSFRVMPKGTAVPIPLLCSAAFGAPIRIGPDEPKEIFLARLRQALLNLSSQ
jgi:1-acyl-sn-glycerol-3-phosphate acyltransferase